MKQNNGFTLVELIGVILLLSLVGLLALPPIVKYIQNSKNAYDESTLKLIYSAANSYIDINPDNYPKEEKNLYCISLTDLVTSGKLSKDILDLNKDNEIPTDKIVGVTFTNNRYEHILMDAEECIENIEPRAPELSGGMIPIIWNGSKWVKADTSSEWYNYNGKKWANAVLVTESKRIYYLDVAPGTEILEADVMAYLVWIPRYKYKLFNVNALPSSPQTIEIKFESKYATKSNGDANGEWLTHPAFTFGDSEVNGIWVGKFETTGNATTPTIKPRVTSIRSQDVSTQFATAKKFNDTKIYGTTPGFDSHMMKNMEWGAVAYLSHSVYGKNSEVWKNNDSNITTGCAGNSASEPLFDGCQNEYDTPLGINASTTGNIYGIYDMSGGSWEYVMGGMYNGDNQTIELSLSGFDQTVIDSETMGKYINKYTYGTTKDDQTAYNRRLLGDATGEVRAWYNDREFFVLTGYPWFIRGGCQSDSTDTGAFAFSALDKPLTGVSFRVVQVKP